VKKMIRGKVVAKRKAASNKTKAAAAQDNAFTAYKTWRRPH